MRLVSVEHSSIDFVELTFKDQFISRSDMWRFTLHLSWQSAYHLKTFELLNENMRAQVKELMIGKQRVDSGLIVPQSKFTFRSRSAAIFWLFQMCKEMWEFAEDGDLFIEKAVDGFAKENFARWDALKSNHSLSIILFSRYYINNKNYTGTSCMKTRDGRLYLDFYKVVALNERCTQNWKQMLKHLKREVMQFNTHVEKMAQQGKLV